MSQENNEMNKKNELNQKLNNKIENDRKRQEQEAHEAAKNFRKKTTQSDPMPEAGLLTQYFRGKVQEREETFSRSRESFMSQGAANFTDFMAMMMSLTKYLTDRVLVGNTKRFGSYRDFLVGKLLYPIFSKIKESDLVQKLDKRDVLMDANVEENGHIDFKFYHRGEKVTDQEARNAGDDLKKSLATSYVLIVNELAKEGVSAEYHEESGKVILSKNNKPLTADESRNFIKDSRHEVEAEVGKLYTKYIKPHLHDIDLPPPMSAPK